ncbi:hypothetical protein EN871_05245 [bacterium M00.F.Ca.ET.228.01.1.1]|uniref:hypothetical protein n=1 Tax=Paraburkholderia phenoliruptrix TaxID=252970 RepID=UPI001091F58B|nr:hypothetical protein [Paraburkholderia phenoliruptrix]MBW9128874.1 hypothetical protein [Paraburkholderia ginsengiterrae]TGP45871.1 hypothetical protein EN871_05245 [bacterium M00.F.Ca.ET.228.01.1.1]TGS04216.1 hypothetical protein EN834_07740 [bacterium M00.F.Ca.ET.191.01.1.1]TGU07164.1 hypothetical protein EN798_09320 [bacterium M00.F.Ca.ET.155.01.1.1]MBW0448564.1 hypothetical protein [Paraburkholderia phenoliruptrix]
MSSIMRFRIRFTPANRADGGSRETHCSRSSCADRACRSDTAQFQPNRAEHGPPRLAMLDRRPRDAAQDSGTRKAGAWVAIIVAAALAIAVQRFAADADESRELRALAGATNCPARYAALLDLAELARRDGTYRDVVMRGLGNNGGAGSAMGECPRLSLSGSVR